MDSLSAVDIEFSYKSENKVVKSWTNININIVSGEVTSLLGVSGVGKTTLLRVLSGLTIPEKGSILINNKEKVKQPFSPIFYVFQDYNSAILPWLNVRENILLGDYKSGHKTSEDELNNLVSLLFKEYEDKKSDFLNTFPKNLSGGQRQRIQIARAVVSRAKFICFDEPDSAVDLHVKLQVRKIINELATVEKKGIALVTHDLDNAIFLSNKIYILVKEGLFEYKNPYRGEQVTPSDYQDFKNKLIQHFIN